MMNDILELCPHCGGKADTEDWQCGYESGTTIRCTECGACVSEGVEGGDGWHERAVAKWNRRAPPEADNAPLTLGELLAISEPTRLWSVGDYEPFWELVEWQDTRNGRKLYWTSCGLGDDVIAEETVKEIYGDSFRYYRRPPEKGA